MLMLMQNVCIWHDKNRIFDWKIFELISTSENDSIHHTVTDKSVSCVILSSVYPFIAKQEQKQEPFD